jgi:pimeloyl-ACP methyl ester carboxylesterase
MGFRVLFLGGNGHCAARLAPARAAAALTGEPLALTDVAYPGFEGRGRAADWDDFLASVSRQVSTAQAQKGSLCLYGMGIGALILLALRARGECLGVSLIFQGPVLWGLKHRLFPNVMRFGPVSGLLPLVFRSSLFQRAFVRRYFTRPLSPAMRRAFFDGYAHCRALSDFFRWLSPSLLHDLEIHFAAHPEGLEHITVWWGERDRVVGLQEMRWTGEALHVHWPLQTFPDWGHYPMLENPQDWVNALTEAIYDR